MAYGTEVSYTLPINTLLVVILQYDVGVDAAAVSPARLYSVVLTGFSTEGDGLLVALCLVECYLKSPATFYGAGRHHRRDRAIKRLLCNDVRGSTGRDDKWCGELADCSSHGVARGPVPSPPAPLPDSTCKRRPATFLPKS